MWIKRSLVFDYFQQNFGQGLTIDNIKQSCQVLKVILSQKRIQEWLNKKAKEKGIEMDNSLISRMTVQDNEDFGKYLERMSKELNNLEEKEKFRFSKQDYEYYKEALDIYAQKCMQMCVLIEKLAGKISISKNTVDYYDFTFNGEGVLLSAVERVAKPLMRNYELAIATYIKANNPQTYFKKLLPPLSFASYTDLLPKKNILHQSLKQQDEYIALTQKQLDKIWGAYKDEDIEKDLEE